TPMSCTVRMPWRTSVLARSVAPVKSSAIAPSSSVMSSPRRWRASLQHRRPAAELLVDMDPDDLVEGILGAEAQALGAPRIEGARPAFDDLDDGGIGLAPYEPHRLLAGDPAQRLDLLGYRDRKSGHGEGAARAHRREIDLRRVDQETHRRERT